MAVYIKGNPVANATSYKLYEKISNEGCNNNLIATSSPSETINGIQYKVNSDGSIKANGTANGVSTFIVYETNSFDLNEGRYYLYGCPAGGSTGGFSLKLEYDSGSSAKVMTDTGSGDSIQISSVTTGKPLTVYIYIEPGVTVNNILFMPMFTSVENAEFGGSTDPFSYVQLDELSSINFEVSEMGLMPGDHILVVKATAEGYDDSDYSNEVSYTQT
jgi:hypothetical protein